MAHRRVGAYAKLLANYASDDAIIAAGEKAELLFVRGLAFCATSDSDGYITDGQLQRVVGAGMRDATTRARTLVREGLWERQDDGYQVRSWTKIHDSAEEKGRARATDRERKRRERDTESEQSPNGQAPDSSALSERTTDDVTPDSLYCSVVNNAVPTTEQSTTEQSTTSGAARTRDPKLTKDTDPRFVEFWSTYPKRVAKADALKALAKVLADGVPVEDVVKGAARYRDDPRRDPEFTAHPATWLNRGQWTDEPTVHRPPATQRAPGDFSHIRPSKDF